MTELVNYVELEILRHTRDGYRIKEIAHLMKMKPSSIEKYRIVMHKRFSVRNAAELIAFAYDNGIFVPRNVPITVLEEPQLV